MLALVLTFYDRTVVTILYGGKFEGAAPLLAILACNQIFVWHQHSDPRRYLLRVVRAAGRLTITLGMLAWNMAAELPWWLRGYGALGAVWDHHGNGVGRIGIACLIVDFDGLALPANDRQPLHVPGGDRRAALLLSAQPPDQFDFNGQMRPGRSRPCCTFTPAAVVLLRVFDPEERRHLRELAWQ